MRASCAMDVPKKVQGLLAAEEHVVGVYSGNRFAGKLVCTDRRVFVVKRGDSSNQTVNIYSYEQIASVHVTYGSRFGLGESVTVLHLSVSGLQSAVGRSQLKRHL